VARWRVRRYGDLAAVVTECEYNFCDMARTLRTGENTFRRPCNFKELRVVKRAHIATCALLLRQPLYRIGRTILPRDGVQRNCFELAYTPLAIMTASPIVSVRVFETSAMRMSARYVRCAPSAVDDISRDHHANNHRFWGHASGPSSSSLRRSHRSIHAGTAMPLAAAPYRASGLVQ